LYDADVRLGGHAHTHFVNDSDGSVVAVDSVLGNEPNHRLPGRSSSAPKKIPAAFKISLARRNSAISLRNALFSSAICDVTPGRRPESTSERRIHVRNVSGVPIPNIAATAVIAAHCDGYCGRTSATMRTARS
jgi:hypothetical protein